MIIDYNHIDDTVDAEFNCTHQDQEVRRKRYKTYVRVATQCVTCGKNLGFIPKEQIDREDVMQFPSYDDDLARTYRARRTARRKDLVAEAKAEGKMAFWRKYDAYLASPEWRERRERVLSRERLYQRRDNPLCTNCFERPGQITHHLNYRRVFSELTTDLTLFCSHCHDEAHGVPEPTY